VTAFDAEQSVLCSPVCLGIIAKTGIIRICRRGASEISPAVQTAWRSAQSGANSSPPKFPANRENNREFEILTPKMALLFSKLHILRGKALYWRKSEQGINRNVSGNLIA
jgi:hypothetical protein